MQQDCDSAEAGLSHTRDESQRRRRPHDGVPQEVLGAAGQRVEAVQEADWDPCYVEKIGFGARAGKINPTTIVRYEL